MTTDPLPEAVVVDLARLGVRLIAYDDGDGRPIVQGKTLVGHPVLGLGHRLDLDGLALDETAAAIADDSVRRFIAWADQALPWWRQLDPVRQHVAIEVALAIGTVALDRSGLPAALGRQHWLAAAITLRHGLGGRIDERRAARLAHMVEWGELP